MKKTVFKFILFVVIFAVIAITLPYLVDLLQSMGSAVMKILFFIAIFVLLVYCVDE